MINLYRLVHYPNETLVLFQGDSTDLEQISQILHFKPFEAKKDYETGHGAYLRGKWREKSEREILHYLQSHYRPLPLELSIFTTDDPLPRTRSQAEWQHFITDYINEYFEGKEHLLDKKHGQSTIYRREPSMRVDELEAYEGISFVLDITPEYKPLLTCSLSYRYHIDGAFADQRVIDDYALEKPEIFTKKHEFETRNTNSQFDLIQQFIRSLPAIPQSNNLRFRIEPITSEELGYETWLWEHEMKPALEVGKGSQVTLAQWISEYGLGLYAPPPADLAVIYVHPDATLDEWCKNANWHKLGRFINDKLHEFLGSHVTLHQLSYSLELTDSDISSKIDQLPELSHTLLTVMIIPPRVKTGHVPSELNDTTFAFQKQLRHLKRGTYVSTVEWTNLLHNDQDYAIESSLLKGFMAIGAQPWRLANMPLCDSEAHSTCFVGIDAIKRRGEAIIGGVILDAWGVLRGYHLYKVPQGTGEFADAHTFTDLTTNLIRHFESATNNKVKHLILHRDGQTHGREWYLLPEKLAEQGITMDLVEIRKRNQPLLRQQGNQWGIPSKDIAIGNCELNKAYLNNTHTIGQNIGRQWIYPAPVAIGVVKVEGPSPLKELAAQVYALTRVNYTSYRRTVHVPATIDYADAMVGNVNLKGAQTNDGRPLGPNAKPYWL